MRQFSNENPNFAYFDINFVYLFSSEILIHWHIQDFSVPGAWRVFLGGWAGWVTEIIPKSTKMGWFYIFFKEILARGLQPSKAPSGSDTKIPGVAFELIGIKFIESANWSIWGLWVVQLPKSIKKKKKKKKTTTKKKTKTKTNKNKTTNCLLKKNSQFLGSLGEGARGGKIFWVLRWYIHEAKKKKCCVALSDWPYSKMKIKKSRVGKALNFAQIGCFLRKMMEYAPKFGPFGCFLKKLLKKNKIFRPTDPTFSEIPLEGNTTIIIFFGLMIFRSKFLNRITFPN